jgi:L-histidine Nalpha-methyltransferase
LSARPESAARRDAAGSGDPALSEAVASGLGRKHKSLPPWLFYDRVGSELFERITELPEYYLTRAEREIFRTHADDIVATAAAGTSAPLHVIELGAGTATKSQILLRAVVRRQNRCLYVPVDVSASALDVAAERLEREEPQVEVRPLAVHHGEATERLRTIPARRLVLFIGSSIGNFDDADAIELLEAVRRGLSRGDCLLLGADRKKDPARLIAAYDDGAGVTAAFNKNVLARINRELGGEFQVDRFRHVAIWNEERSRIEMHLESMADQTVGIEALEMEVRFAAGERIFTESSNKYDTARIDALLGRAGFRRERTFSDAEGLFGVHVARVEAAT